MTVKGHAGRELTKLLDEKGVPHCYQCSRCTSVCPTALVTDDFNPRQIILHLLLDESIDELEDEAIWKCVTCHSCEEACPKGVKVAGIIHDLRNQAFLRGKAPRAYLTNVGLLLRSGLVANMGGVDRVRKQVGLEMPRTPDLEELMKLLQGCNIKGEDK